MTDSEKIIEYELQIEDMLNTLKMRLNKFDALIDLSEFEQGRQLAYTEIMDIIKTRHEMIFDVIGEAITESVDPENDRKFETHVRCSKRRSRQKVVVFYQRVRHNRRGFRTRTKRV